MQGRRNLKTCLVALAAMVSAGLVSEVWADGVDLGIATGSLVGADANGYTTVDVTEQPKLTLHRYSRDGVRRQSRVIAETAPATAPSFVSVSSHGGYVMAFYNEGATLGITTPNFFVRIWNLLGDAVFQGTLPNHPAGFNYLSMTSESDAIFLVSRSTGGSGNLAVYRVDATAGSVRQVLLGQSGPERLYPSSLSIILAHSDGSGLSLLDAQGSVLKTVGFASMGGAPRFFSTAMVLEPDTDRPTEIDVIGTWNFQREVITLDRATLTAKRRLSLERILGVSVESTNVGELGALKGGRFVGLSLSLGPRSTLGTLLVTLANSTRFNSRFGVFPRFYWGGPSELYVNRGDCGIDTPVVCSTQIQRIERIDLSAKSNPVVTVTGAGGVVRLETARYGSGGAPSFLPIFVDAQPSAQGGFEIPLRLESVEPGATLSVRSIGNDHWALSPNGQKLVSQPSLPAENQMTSPIALEVQDARGITQTVYFYIRHAPRTVIDIVEFYNTQLGHFFMTTEGAEAAGIDSGAAGPGWVRTGGGFKAWRTPSEAPAGSRGVCRFYGNPSIGVNGRRLGPNSHFYTVDPQECNAVAKDAGWLLETREAFYVRDPAIGCPTSGGYSPIVRFYNNGYPTRDSNHRFVLNPPLASGDLAAWSNEGVRFCAAKEGIYF